MKPLNLITLILLIVGGLNWGLVGLFNFDLVADAFRRGLHARPHCLHFGRPVRTLAGGSTLCSLRK